MEGKEEEGQGEIPRKAMERQEESAWCEQPALQLARHPDPQAEPTAQPPLALRRAALAILAPGTLSTAPAGAAPPALYKRHQLQPKGEPSSAPGTPGSLLRSCPVLTPAERREEPTPALPEQNHPPRARSCSKAGRPHSSDDAPGATGTRRPRVPEARHKTGHGAAKRKAAPCSAAGNPAAGHRGSSRSKDFLAPKHRNSSLDTYGVPTPSWIKFALFADTTGNPTATQVWAQQQ